MKNFKYKNLSELRQSCSELGVSHIDFEEDPERVREILARPVTVGGFSAGNSICIHPMEGCDGTLDGTPGELTWRRYRRFAQGGAKLIWFEATAVSNEGRANTRQLWITRANAGEYAALLAEIRKLHAEIYGTADDLLIPVQLTHSGRYCVHRRIIAYHNPLIDRKTNVPPDYPVITDDELDRLQDEYVAAAKLTVEAGFRAIDVKVTHGYLLSELMGAKTREGRYGGSIENRSRFECDLLRRLRSELGKEILLTMRLGCFDGVPYVMGPDKTGVPLDYPIPYPWGFGVNPQNPLEPDLTEVKQAIGLFRDAGLQLLNVSLGCPYYNPHIGRPFESPDDGNYEPPEHPLYGVDRHFAVAGELQRTFPDLPMVGTGYSWLQVFSVNAGAKNIADGNIRFFGLGRNALAYPDFPRAIAEKGMLDQLRVCKTLTYCTYLMRQKDHPLGQFPTGCPPFDKEGYGQIMKEARAAQRTRISPAKT
jgi:2,4-dienoyl-CoA reductase-like NADH-dependent reductase (Old Yellow Enzyme family)